MQTLLLITQADPRTLKKQITLLLKAGVCTQITKINYAQGFSLDGKNIVKTHQKILLLHFDSPEMWEKFPAKRAQFSSKIPATILTHADRNTSKT